MARTRIAPSTIPTLLSLLSSPLLLLLQACPESGVKKFNAAPEAVITSHEEGSLVDEDEALTLWGVASDPDDAAETLLAGWYVADATVCPPAAPNPEDGSSFCVVRLKPSAPTVLFVVQDPDDLAGQDQRTFVVDPNATPTAAVEAPLEDGEYFSDQKISFLARVSDEEDPPEELTVDWSSDLDGSLDFLEEPDSEGWIRGSGYLSPGAHTLALTVTDTTGRRSGVSLVVDVAPPNTAPSCGILAPEDGLTVALGASVAFEALVSDPDEAANRLRVTWTSDWDGLLATSTPDTSGSVRFLTSSLSANRHVVTLAVADARGGTCVDTVLVPVDTPPTLEILSPAEASSFSEEESVLFDVRVSDAEDPVESLLVRWTLDGATLLDEGGPDSSGRRSFRSDALPVGTRTLRATVADLDEFEAYAEVVVEIFPCTTSWYRDADGDGFGDARSSTTGCAAPVGHTRDSSDCDDTLAAVNPGAVERCNGRDDDCDDVTDEDDAVDASTWYRDADGDGYGTSGATTRACTLPSDYASVATDCDDTRSTVWPGALELCDGLDNDCDGTRDEGTACYDDDGDGYTEDGGDCDDGDPAVHPGAVEVCNGVDDDCDGVEDEPFGSWDFTAGIGPSVMRLNRSAEQIWYGSDGYIELTDTVTYDAGSAFFVDLIPGDVWRVSFQAWIGGGTGADGLVFAFMDETDPTICADEGGELGISGYRGYAVELDVFQNVWDPNGNHLALDDARSFAHLATATSIPTLENTGDHLVVVTYDAGLVTVELDGIVYIETRVSLYDPDAWLMGFAATTGDYTNWHVIDDVFIGCP